MKYQGIAQMQQKLLPIAIVFLLVASSCAQGVTTSVDKLEVSALEHLWKRAEEKGDIRALGPMLDDDITYVDENGSLLTKAQFLSYVQQSGGHLQSLAMQTISMNVYNGETAVVVGSYLAKGEQTGKSYRREGRFIDTWVLKKGKWVCVVSQETPILR